jgi:hypothetical protein
MRLLDRFDVKVASVVDRKGQTMAAEAITVAADGTRGVSCGIDRTVAPGIGLAYPAGDIVLEMQAR